MQKKRLRNVIVTLVVIGLLIILIANFFNYWYFSYPNRGEVCFENNCFEVELAVTEEEQTLGLGNRTSLDSNKGMLFVFKEEGDYPFWMQGMLFPLDIIWISNNGTVVDIGRDMTTCYVCFGIYPEANATYVLELNANVTNQINLSLGDKMELRIPKRYL